MPTFRAEISNADDGSRVATLYMDDVAIVDYPAGDDEDDQYIERLANNAVWTAQQVARAMEGKSTPPRVVVTEPRVARGIR